MELQYDKETEHFNYRNHRQRWNLFFALELEMML
jgi:hypothetical protein